MDVDGPAAATAGAGAGPSSAAGPSTSGKGNYMLPWVSKGSHGQPGGSRWATKQSRIGVGIPQAPLQIGRSPAHPPRLPPGSLLPPRPGGEVPTYPHQRHRGQCGGGVASAGHRGRGQHAQHHPCGAPAGTTCRHAPLWPPPALHAQLAFLSPVAAEQFSCWAPDSLAFPGVEGSPPLPTCGVLRGPPACAALIPSSGRACTPLHAASAAGPARHGQDHQHPVPGPRAAGSQLPGGGAGAECIGRSRHRRGGWAAPCPCTLGLGSTCGAGPASQAASGSALLRCTLDATSMLLPAGTWSDVRPCWEAGKLLAFAI